MSTRICLWISIFQVEEWIDGAEIRLFLLFWHLCNSCSVACSFSKWALGYCSERFVVVLCLTTSQLVEVRKVLSRAPTTLRAGLAPSAQVVGVNNKGSRRSKDLAYLFWVNNFIQYLVLPKSHIVGIYVMWIDYSMIHKITTRFYQVLWQLTRINSSLWKNFSRADFDQICDYKFAVVTLYVILSTKRISSPAAFGKSIVETDIGGFCLRRGYV